MASSTSSPLFPPPRLSSVALPRSLESTLTHPSFPFHSVLACEVSAMTTSGGWKWRVMGVASQ